MGQKLLDARPNLMSKLTAVLKCIDADVRVLEDSRKDALVDYDFCLDSLRESVAVYVRLREKYDNLGFEMEQYDREVSKLTAKYRSSL